MEIGQFVEALRDDLARMADIADEESQRVANRLSTALESSVRLRVMDLLGALAADLDDQLRDARVEVRLAGSEPELVVVADEDPAEDSDDDPESDQAARLTLRLPPRLKARIDDAANAAGVSTNTWVVRALKRATATSSNRGVAGARRLRGYGRS